MGTVVSLLATGEVILFLGAICRLMTEAILKLLDAANARSIAQWFQRYWLPLLFLASIIGAVASAVYGPGDDHGGHTAKGIVIVCFDRVTVPATDAIHAVHHDLEPFAQMSEGIRQARDDCLPWATNFTTSRQNFLLLSCSLKYERLPEFLASNDERPRISEVDDAFDQVLQHRRGCLEANEKFVKEGKGEELIGKVERSRLRVLEELACREKMARVRCRSGLELLGAYDTVSLKIMNETLEHASRTTRSLIDMASVDQPCGSDAVEGVAGAWRAFRSAPCGADFRVVSEECERQRGKLNEVLAAWEVRV